MVNNSKQNPSEKMVKNWQASVVGDAAAAQKRLDWVAKHGCEERGLIMENSSSIIVYWMDPGKPDQVKAGDLDGNPVRLRLEQYLKDRNSGRDSTAPLPVVDSEGWTVAVVPNLDAAEATLDVLEKQGYKAELLILGNSVFSIRFKNGPKSLAEGKEKPKGPVR